MENFSTSVDGELQHSLKSFQLKHTSDLRSYLPCLKGMLQHWKHQTVLDSTMHLFVAPRCVCVCVCSGYMVSKTNQGCDLFEFSTVSDGDPFGGFSRARAKCLYLLHHLNPILHTTKHHVPPIQPFRFNCTDKELGAIGVGPSVGHGENTWSSVLQFEVLIRKSGAVDGLPASAIVVGEVSTLTHKLWDDSVEDGTFITITMFSCTQSPEVLCCFGNNISIQLEGDSPQGLVIRGNVEVNYRVSISLRSVGVQPCGGKGQGAELHPVADYKHRH